MCFSLVIFCVEMSSAASLGTASRQAFFEKNVIYILNVFFSSILCAVQ